MILAIHNQLLNETHNTHNTYVHIIYIRTYIKYVCTYIHTYTSRL